MIGLRRLALLFALCGVVPAFAAGAPWFPLGPYGGDARSFAADPADSHHLYLGTTNGWLYETHDAGANWVRVSQVGKRDDLVLDNVLVDPANSRRLIVGAYRVDREDGGVYISQDGGKNWYEQAQMRGQSVRSLARSASDPKIVIAGTLRGIYRSSDDGVHWALISPAGSQEIHEIESLAVDPTDPKIIYAGTWHLPWKTEDGGENWVNIKQGIIDDSDVFSIIVDPENPKTVYVSACSGIYKSNDAAAQFRKIQGIPSTARRTRKLLEDPTNFETVYAGTTEGLYKTQDGGKTFARMTEANIVINDVYVDPASPSHVLLATDRGGILSSEDGGASFHDSSLGFSARQVLSFAADGKSGSSLYVGVVNGKETGGVFQSSDGGLKWQQQSAGLGGRDVFSLVSTSEGTLLAGTAHGIFRLNTDGWTDTGDLAMAALPVDAAQATPPAPKPQKQAPPSALRPLPLAPRPLKTEVKAARPHRTRTHVAPAAVHKRAAIEPKAHGKATLRRVAQNTQKRGTAKGSPAKKPAQVKEHHPASEIPVIPAHTPARIDSIVYSLVVNGDGVYAGTEQGLLHSTDDGRLWQRVSSLEMPEVHFLSASQDIILAGGFKELQISSDKGETWTAVQPPGDVTQISSIAVDEMKNLWVGGAEGVFFSPDHGATWKTLRNLFVRQVNGIYFDAPNHRVLIASSGSQFAFAVHLPDYKVSYWESGWPLRFVRPVGDHLIGATLFDGMVLQPQMIDSPFNPTK